ncbi:MAG: glycosyltransferase [Acidobacteriaceae bacterium]|nr:glycosyltransferase [Acidobacteriaceae bacterium]
MTTDGGEAGRRRRILIFIDHYLPGFKFGGPVRTIANLVSHLSDRYEFFIFTFDRDKGDVEPYGNLPREQWTQVEKAKVFYTANRSLRNIRRRAEEISPELLYLNSFFSLVSIKILLAKNAGLFPNLPVLLAPRGEFSSGALIIKPRRKRAYIELVNRAKLLKSIAIQASTEYERVDIETHLRRGRSLSTARLIVASDIAEISPGPPRLINRVRKSVGLLRLLYLARISPNKNLDGALRMLKGVKGRVIFSIYGPIGNRDYWATCQRSIKQLPSNITVEYKGGARHELVHEIFCQHDLLFLPTHGENYGHVIVESLCAGCPVLISDRTPWRNLEECGVGADFPLEAPEEFQRVLEAFVEMDNKTALEYSQRAYDYAVQRTQNEVIVEQNIKMFKAVLKDEDIY